MVSSKKVTSGKKPSKPTPTANLVSKDGAAPNDATTADLVDEQLARYRSMRDFDLTEEPSGQHKSTQRLAALPFCVQKHAASHLHYDFRLGWNGVLKSWAVAKGPSYFTGDKRLAVQVEDHPLEYGGFEGIIPKGQYGGGTVMLWDQGTWEPQAEYTDIAAGLRDGSLKFVLHGTRLKGKWALIRMKGRWEKESKPNWLLIKEHDSFERKQDAPAITDTEQTSAITGRTMEEIARNEDHIWNSKQTNSGVQAWTRKKTPAPHPSSISAPPANQPKEQQPKFVEPELATMANLPPSSAGWLHELKLDGYRMQARKSGGKVQMMTRSGLDWTDRMSALAKELARLPVDQITLDGELVVVAENGTTSFADLQASMQDGSSRPLSFFAFDLLHLNGRNTRQLRLRERKQLLGEIFRSIESDSVRLSEYIETGGEKLLREACKLHAEGIVSKRDDSVYKSGRSADWVKTKCLHEQEFVVGGFTLPTNGSYGIGALLLGYYRKATLIYAGRTGTGFTQKLHKSLRDQLEKLLVKSTAFASVPSDAIKGVHWVSPKLVVQVRFATWTADDLVRQAAFLGIREDKNASEVVREENAIQPKLSRAMPGARKLAPDPPAFSTTKTQTATLRLTHPDKVLDPESSLTKQMLANYYWEIADSMLPEISDRPVSLVRCPDGVGKPSFFQKHSNDTLPDSIGSVDVPDKKTGKIEKYVTVSSKEALASLAQMGVLELHPWGSRNGDLEHPDRVIFDLDPDESLGWDAIVQAAIEVRFLLTRNGLQSFVKTTGGKGLHVVAPIEPSLTWLQLKEFAQKLALSLQQKFPTQYLTKMTKAARAGKIYLDYLRNERGATSVAAYSPRARHGAPVSMPLSWEELHGSLERPRFSVMDFSEWKHRLQHDPWKKIGAVQQRIKT